MMQSATNHTTTHTHKTISFEKLVLASSRQEGQKKGSTRNHGKQLRLGICGAPYSESINSGEALA
jgi:hypothetical protein